MTRIKPADSHSPRSPIRGGDVAPSAPAAPVHLRLRVMPRTSKDALRLEADGSLRVWVQAPPVDGAANAAVMALLAARLRVPKHAIALVRGATSREKVVAIAGLSADEVTRRLSDDAGR